MIELALVIAREIIEKILRPNNLLVHKVQIYFYHLVVLQIEVVLVIALELELALVIVLEIELALVIALEIALVPGS